MTRRGFTLIEVSVALVLAGLAMTIAATLLGGIADRLDRLVEDATEHERRAVARAWLDQAFTGVDVGPDEERRFVGTADSVRFRTSLWVARGWTESGETRIGRREGALTLEHGSNTVVLFDTILTAAFEYHVTSGDSVRWLRQWDSYTAAPTAVRLVLRRHEGETFAEELFLVRVP